MRLTELGIDDVDGVLQRLDLDGAVIVHDMLAPEVLNQIRQDFTVAFEGTGPGARGGSVGVQRFWGGNTKRFTRLAWRSRTFADQVLVHPLMVAVADALLRPNCASYWMNTGQMMIIGPGERAQVLHRDADNWPHMNSPAGAEVTVSCMFALSDFSDDLGATRVVPGSHRWDDFSRQPEPSEVTQAVMPAGSAMIYTGRAVHGAGANVTTDQWRHGMHLSYVVGWLTPEEAGCIGVPPEQAKTMTPLQQRLLGYRCYANDRDANRLWTVDYEDIPVGLGW